MKKLQSINSQTIKQRSSLNCASLTHLLPNRRLTKGDLTRVVICGRRQLVKRYSGINSSLGCNLGVGIKKDQTPVASRLYGQAYLELRYHGWLRLAVLARQLL